MSANHFVTESGRCTSGVLTGRFRRTATLDDRGSSRVVSMAVARAKEGDSEALRYLYVRYADNVYGYVASIVRERPSTKAAASAPN